jgi:hypothetical protein
MLARLDPGTADPIDLRKRHRPAEYGGRVRTGHGVGRSAVEHKSGHRAEAQNPFLFFLNCKVERGQGRPSPSALAAQSRAGRWPVALFWPGSLGQGKKDVDTGLVCSVNPRPSTRERVADDTPTGRSTQPRYRGVSVP